MHRLSTRHYDKLHFEELNQKDGKSYVASWYYLFVPFFVSPLSPPKKSKRLNVTSKILICFLHQFLMRFEEDSGGKIIMYLGFWSVQWIAFL